MQASLPFIYILTCPLQSSSHVPRAASPSLSILSSSSSHSDDELLDDEASLSTTQEDEVHVLSLFPLVLPPTRLLCLVLLLGVGGERSRLFPRLLG